MAKKTTEVPTSMKSGSEIIREILEGGIEKPAEVVQVALDKYETTINKSLVNQVKMAWKKKKGGTAAKIDKTPKAAKAPAKKATLASGASVNNGLMPSELDVAKFALRCGGIDAAITALKNLVK